jgi:hypothetical protein
MSFRRLVPLVALLAVFAMALRFSIGSDTYWHLRAGDWMLSEGSLLKVDPFSLTRLGSEWIYPGWLAQISLTAAYRWMGFPGLNLLTALVVTTTFAFVWKTMREGPLLRAFVLLFAATVSAVYWSARPHIFTFLLTAITLWALAKFRRKGFRAIWMIPVLTAVWANVHGGFVIPILLIGLEILAMLLDVLLPKLRIAIQRFGNASVSEAGGALVEEEAAVESQVAATHDEPKGGSSHESKGQQDQRIGRLKTQGTAGSADWEAENTDWSRAGQHRRHPCESVRCEDARLSP